MYFSKIIYSINLFIYIQVILISAKQKNRLKDMLREVAEETNEISRNRYPKLDSNAEDFESYGWHHGSINPKNYEYKGQLSFMTSEEAVTKCETDDACGGFTFYGVDVPNRKHYIFFVHFIPFGNINKRSKSSALWNTYRSMKKVICLSGKVCNTSQIMIISRCSFSCFQNPVSISA